MNSYKLSWIPGLSPDLKAALRRCLAAIRIQPRDVPTGKGHRSPYKYVRVTGMVPQDLGEAFHAMPGVTGQNLERAIRLFMEAQPLGDNKP